MLFLPLCVKFSDLSSKVRPDYVVCTYFIATIHMFFGTCLYHRIMEFVVIFLDDMKI
jgi:hypothetical protein